MTTLQNTSTSKATSLTFAQEGINLGWRADFRLSALYAISVFLIVESLDKGIGFLQLAFNPNKLIVTIFEFVMISIAAFLLAILPAAILGTLTGLCLGKLAEAANERLPNYLVSLLCALFCLAIVALIHLMFQIPVRLSFQLPFKNSSIGIYETYQISIGLPSIIYILTGGWIGWRISSKRTNQIDV